MPAFPMQQHVDTNMKKFINTLLSVYFFGMMNFVYAQESLQYSFTSHLISKNEISFVYKNESGDAHCIQVADFSFKLLGDALYVISAKGGESMKYIGPLGKQGAIGTQDFIILPPSEYTTSSIRITDFYKLKRGGAYVSYSMPVIPCKHLMKKYVSMPLPGFMRSKINDPTVEKTDVYAKDYPEWTQFGFIAVSKPLLIDN